MVYSFGTTVEQKMWIFWKKKMSRRAIGETASLIGGSLARVDFSEILEVKPSVPCCTALSSSGTANALREDMTFSESTAGSSGGLSAGVLLGKILDEGIGALRLGKFKYAGDCFQRVVFADLDHGYAQVMLKMADFWVEKSRRYEFLPESEKSDFLIGSWKNFSDHVLVKMEFVFDRALFAIRGWLFSEVAYYVSKQLRESPQFGLYPELYLKLGRAYKMRGDYDLAIDAYLEGVSLSKEEPRLLAELADCYAIVDEEVKARLFFREALFHGAMGIDFDSLESAMILNLQKKVSQIRPSDKYSPEWLGVYGVLWGIFSLGRELTPSEFAKLNQSIHMLRSEIEDIPVKREVLVPRLIYRLFWLIDYYKHLNGESEMCKKQIRSALLDIRFLDERVSRDYTF